MSYAPLVTLNERLHQVERVCAQLTPKQLNSTQRLILFALAYQELATLGTLAVMCGLSKDTIKRHLGGLHSRMLVTRVTTRNTDDRARAHGPRTTWYSLERQL